MNEQILRSKKEKKSFKTVLKITRQKELIQNKTKYQITL